MTGAYSKLDGRIYLIMKYSDAVEFHRLLKLALNAPTYSERIGDFLAAMQTDELETVLREALYDHEPTFYEIKAWAESMM